MLKTQLDRDINDQGRRLQNAERSYASKMQQAQSVIGENLAERQEFAQMMADVEQTRHKHYMNALSTILAEFPDFSQMIEATLADNGIQVPSRPQTPSERPDSRSTARSGR